MTLMRLRVMTFGKVWYCSPLFQLRSNSDCVRMYGKFYQPRRSNLLYLSLLGVGAGAFVGAGYSYNKFKESQKPAIVSEQQLPRINEFPTVAVSKKVQFANCTSDLKLSLFQYATCPFCCKVRAYFDYYGISYDIIEVNPVMRQQIKWSHYKKVPIVVAKHENNLQQLNDSSMIISALATFFMDNGLSLQDIIKFYPTVTFKEDGYEKTEILNRYFLMCQDKNLDEKNKAALASERKWRKWVDDTFVHVLSPNVYRTREEAFETFHWFSEAGEWDKQFPEWERAAIIYVGACAMWLISKRLKKRHNLKEDVRQSFYDECNFWLKEIKKKGTLFMGGKEPDLSDLAVYGVLKSVEGSRAFQDVLKNTNLGKWYFAVKSEVENHKGSNRLQR